VRSGEAEVPVTITRVRQGTYGNLNVDDAIRDGFETVAALQTGLLTFYPDISNISEITIVEFCLR